MQLADITLPDNCYWADEYAFEPVAQSRVRTLTGGQVVEELALQGGRPVTIEGLWVPRSTVDALEALRAQSATPMALTLPDARELTVLWRRGNAAAVESEPLFPLAEPSAGTTYAITLRLLEV